MATNFIGVSRIQNLGNGLLHKVNKIFARRCWLYIAKGKLMQADIPNDLASLKALYTGNNAPFIQFGRMDSSGTNVKSTPITQEIDHGDIVKGHNIALTMVSITVSAESLTFADELNNDEYTILCVPDEAENIFLAINGINLLPETEIPIVDGDNTAKINYKGNRKANKITDVILFKEFPDTNREHFEQD